MALIFIQKNSDFLFKIDINKNVESLNIFNSAAVVFHYLNSIEIILNYLNLLFNTSLKPYSSIGGATDL